MSLIRRFAQFWIDFIVGDAWEVAVGGWVALVVAGLLAHQRGVPQAAGLVLLVAVIGVTWLALLRTTAKARRH